MHLGRQKPTDSVVRGYPVVTQYRYLGVVLQSDLSIDAHLKAIEAKVNFITYRTLLIRLKAQMKTNVNLFKCFIMPQYRLAFQIEKIRGRDTNLKKIVQHCKMRLKKFLLLPCSTSDAWVKRIFVPLRT
jgi:hypothetical protein